MGQQERGLSATLTFYWNATRANNSKSVLSFTGFLVRETDDRSHHRSHPYHREEVLEEKSLNEDSVSLQYIKESDEAQFSKKCPGTKLDKIGPKWPKSGVFGHFLDFESLDFSDFVYNDRQQ